MAKYAWLQDLTSQRHSENLAGSHPHIKVVWVHKTKKINHLISNFMVFHKGTNSGIAKCGAFASPSQNDL